MCVCVCLGYAHTRLPLQFAFKCVFSYLSNQIFEDPESSFTLSSQQAMTSTQLQMGKGETSNFLLAVPNCNITAIKGLLQDSKVSLIHL